MEISLLVLQCSKWIGDQHFLNPCANFHILHIQNNGTIWQMAESVSIGMAHGHCQHTCLFMRHLMPWSSLAIFSRFSQNFSFPPSIWFSLFTSADLMNDQVLVVNYSNFDEMLEKLVDRKFQATMVQGKNVWCKEARHSMSCFELLCYHHASFIETWSLLTTTSNHLHCQSI